MKVLAIDTATEQCSAALSIDGRVFERSVLTARSHAELLLPMIEAVLAQAGLRLADLDGLAFGRGPGAFTGVRIAAGVIQGLSLGSGLPVAGVSTLAAVAQQAVGRGHEVLVCMDARMNEVYWGVFRAGEGGLAVPVGEERVSSPGGVDPQGRSIGTGMGTGFRAYPDLTLRFAGLQIDDSALPHAREIAVLGEAALRAGQGCRAHEAQPVYLRDQVAWRL